MATMNVAMHLTLADTASAPLRAFTAIVEQLEAAVNRLTPRLAAAAAEMSRFASPAATANVSALGSAINAVTGQLAGLAGALGTVTAAYGTLGTAAATTGGAMNQHLAATNAQATTLGSTLKGLAELWAAVKIEKGLKESAQEAMAFQNTETRLRTMNVSPEDRAAMTSAALSASRSIPQFNQNEMLTMAIDLRNATGSVTEAIHMLPEFAKAIFVMKSALPPGVNFGERDTLNVAKVLEQRNATLDPAKMQAELDMIAKIYAATQGRVDAASMLGNLQQAKGGLGQAMDLEALPFFAAVIQELRSSGSGGSAGTMLTTLQRYVLGNARNGISAKQAGDLGLIDDQKLVYNSQGSINLKKSDLTMAGADEFQRNPFLWIENYLKPALRRAGIDLTNDAAVNQVLTKLFPDRNAAQFAGMAINRGALIGKEAGNINQALGVDGQYAEVVKNASTAISEFKAQLENLAIVMGTTLLPAITAVAHAFSEGFQWLAAFFTEHPIVAQIATWSAALIALGLAVAGVVAMFGLFTGGVGAVLPILAGFGGLVATVFGALTSALTTVLPLLAAFFAGWSFGKVIASMEIFGKSVQEHTTDLIEWYVDSWAKGLSRIASLFSKLYKSAPGPTGTAQYDANGNYLGEYAGLDNGSDYGNEGRRMAVASGGSSLSSLGAAMAAAGGGTGQRNRLFRGGKGSSTDADGNPSGGRGRAGKPDYLGAIRGEGAGQEQAKQDFLRSEKAVYGELAKMDADAAKESARLDKDKLDLERELLQTSGQRHAAEALHVEQEIAAKVQALVLAHRITQEEADTFLARAHAATELKLHAEDVAKAQEQYADRLVALQDAERNGTLSQTAAEDEKLRLLKEEAQITNVLLQQQLERAQASNNEGEVLRIQKQMRANDSIQGQLPADQIQLLKGAQRGFENFFGSILSGTKSVKDAFRSLGHSILDTINGIVSKRLGDALFDSLFGAAFGSGQQGGASGAGLGGSSGLFGGALSGAGNWLGSLFGGGGGAATDTFAAAGGSFADAFASGIIPLATGMDYVPDTMLAQLHKGERVMTAAENARYSSGSGRSQVNHINVSPPAGMSKQAAGQLGATISKQLALADRRNN